MTVSRLSLKIWPGMMPRNTVQLIKPTWRAFEMSGPKPTSSCWLWISKFLFGLDCTNRCRLPPTESTVLEHKNNYRLVPGEKITETKIINCTWLAYIRVTWDRSLTRQLTILCSGIQKCTFVQSIWQRETFQKPINNARWINMSIWSLLLSERLF